MILETPSTLPAESLEALYELREARILSPNKQM